MEQINSEVWQAINQAFCFVRDIPFTVYFQGESGQMKLIDAVLKKGASCSTKHEVMGKVLQMLDIDFQFASYPFLWQDLKVEFSQPLRQLAKKMPLTYHLVLFIKINEKRFLLDATWDSALANTGLPINYFDYAPNCKLAIPPCDEPIIHHELKDRHEFIRAKWLSTSNEKANLQASFYSGLNSWLKASRV